MNQAVMQDRDGFMYLASSTIMRYGDGTEWRPMDVPQETVAPRRLVRTDDGTIYVGGVCVIGYLQGAGATARFVSLADKLPPTKLGCDEIHDVIALGQAVYFADEEKILIWRDGRFSVIPYPSAPHSQDTRLHAAGGVVYVTTPGQPLRRIVDDRLEPVADDPVLRENTIVMIEPGSDGALRLLSKQHGFFQLRDGKVEIWPQEANRWLEGRGILRAVRMYDGELAVIFDSPSGSGGMRFDAEGHYVGPIDHTLGLYISQFRDLFCDREGGLWLGSTVGVFRIEWPSAVTVFDVVNGLGTEAVETIRRHDGVLEATTAEGVFRLRPMDAQGHIAHFERVAEAVPGDYGVAGKMPDVRILQRLPKLIGRTVGTAKCWLEEDGPAGRILWIGGTEGLLRVELDRAPPEVAPLNVILSAAGVHESEALMPEHDPLRFDYTAIRYQTAGDVSYQTRLTGFDQQWSEWSGERMRSFTRLPAGSYRFEVRARDLDGLISPVQTIAFTVRPPWWWSWWMVLGYVAVGAGLLTLWVRHHTRALRRRAEQLEAVVADRTKELARQNVELVRLNKLELDEKITARLAEEKARLESLRYQLNPHFLFNTLASISAALGVERSTARMMLERLTDFCRLTLHRANDDEWTTLGEEMKLLRAYLDIEQSRWGDLLEVTIDCAPELAGERLPHFLLLPLVENALKYGHATSEDKVGLRLTARREADGALLLEVANTGKWIEPAAKKSGVSLGIGLGNLRERLRRHYLGRHDFVITSTEGWIIVRLRIHAPPLNPAASHATDAAH